MARKGSDSKFRMLAPLALAILVLGAASCGDSDDDGGATAQGQSQDGDQVPVDNSPEGQVRAAYAKFTDTFYSKDPAAICATLTPKAQREWTSKTAKTCEAGIKNFFDTSVGLGKNRPYIVRLRIDGSRALAMVKTKTSNTYPVPMVKQDGQWKIDQGGGPDS